MRLIAGSRGAGQSSLHFLVLSAPAFVHTRTGTGAPLDEIIIYKCDATQCNGWGSIKLQLRLLAFALECNVMPLLVGPAAVVIETLFVTMSTAL